MIFGFKLQSFLRVPFSNRRRSEEVWNAWRDHAYTLSQVIWGCCVKHDNNGITIQDILWDKTKI